MMPHFLFWSGAITPEKEAFLQKHGRSGVPFYPLFPADPDADPIVLPQLLTASDVQKALDQLE